MSENESIRCPQCATLYTTGEARCPHCGLPSDPVTRQQHIEQLLSGAQSVSAPAQPPIIAEPASRAFESANAPVRAATGAAAASPYGAAVYPSAPPPAPEGGACQVRWESTPLGEPEAPPRFFKRHKLPILLSAVGVVLFVAVVLVATGVRNARLGYRASPERLVAGIQKAMNEQDVQLFCELLLPDGTDFESYMSDNHLSDNTMPAMELTLRDILMGTKGRYALALVDIDIRDTSAGTSAQMQPLAFYKKDGRWYCDGQNGLSLRYLLSSYR